MSIRIRARAVLLDMDGTLVDSTAVVERIWSEWATDHDLASAEVLKVVHGRQGHESMALLLPDRPHRQNLAENQIMLERETAEVEGIVAIAGARALLESIARLPHALVTSAPRQLAWARMTTAGLTMPAVAVTAEDVSASKPDPEGFTAAAATLGVPARTCVAFEDSAAGITAARRAGMRVVGVGRTAAGHRADWTVPDLSGIQISADSLELTITIS
ncbi:HAD-IA family hydrolase [Nocardioides sp. NPDC101246]|uniref:HAD-IA family hydrolase n=1 Tax=Nocardioides sp. NPDC101246 TaxID=3364336 RepID=UPI0037F92B2E